MDGTARVFVKWSIPSPADIIAYGNVLASASLGMDFRVGNGDVRHSTECADGGGTRVIVTKAAGVDQCRGDFYAAVGCSRYTIPRRTDAGRPTTNIEIGIGVQRQVVDCDVTAGVGDVVVRVEISSDGSPTSSANDGELVVPAIASS